MSFEGIFESSHNQSTQTLSVENIKDAIVAIQNQRQVLYTATKFIVYVPNSFLVELKSRNYARNYNYRHPSRRVSWRKLNRRQLQQALGE